MYYVHEALVDEATITFTPCLVVEKEGTSRWAVLENWNGEGEFKTQVEAQKEADRRNKR